MGCYQRSRFSVVTIITVFLAIGSGFSQTAIPDTPAGKVLRVWLNAFNSGDRAKSKAT
jgi:hypothetical protein